jgi:hypothetical protein
LFSAGVTFSLWGWVGLVIGLLVLGFGVVPMAVIAGLVKGYPSLAVTVIVLAVITWVMRVGGAAAVESD